MNEPKRFFIRENVRVKMLPRMMSEELGEQEPLLSVSLSNVNLLNGDSRM